MATIVRQLPFRSFESTLSLPSGETVKILHRQIVLWVSLSSPGQTQLTSSLPRFPAILDIGLNESFAISREHFNRWSGLIEDELDPLEQVLMYDRRVVAREADLWIYRNVPFARDDLLEAEPFHVEIDAGILISPVANKPRLPLLGLRAFESAGLQLLLDGVRQLVSIRSVL
ncbi:MAG TPA: hypothetical protein VFI31_23720 [Pirellulales bacterium]|nr:hypothetical protein [Pirellulales bacterium]